MKDLREDIVELLTRVGTDQGALDDVERRVGAIASTLQSSALSRLVPGQPWEQLSLGIGWMSAHIELYPVLCALSSIRSWAPSPGELQVDRLSLVMREIARKRLAAALSVLSNVGTMPAGSGPSSNEQTLDARPLAAGGAAHLGVLRNIAQYHRAHERFYAQAHLELAADLMRESNKLKIISRIWCEGSVRDGALTDVDYADPAFQAAGCPDLNALDAIPAIGVLFMEGEGEPAEIRVMKAKLSALGQAWTRVGDWLAKKMDAAWNREVVVFTAPLLDLAEVRYATISTNYRGARDLELCGRILSLAVAALDAIELHPQAVRRNPQFAGRKLLEVAWLLTAASQIKARSAADLAGNDVNWTAYLERMNVQLSSTAGAC